MPSSSRSRTTTSGWPRTGRILNTSTTALDRSAQYADAANTCYEGEFNALIAGIRSGAIPKPEARQRFSEIQSGLGEVKTILGDVLTNSQDKAQKFDTAMTEEHNRNPQLFAAPVQSGDTDVAATTGRSGHGTTHHHPATPANATLSGQAITQHSKPVEGQMTRATDQISNNNAEFQHIMD